MPSGNYKLCVGVGQPPKTRFENKYPKVVRDRGLCASCGRNIVVQKDKVGRHSPDVRTRIDP